MFSKFDSEMKKDNRLVAYIEFDGGIPFIDIVEVSKKGTSFFYNGTWWMREPVFRMGLCTNHLGQKVKISPLNRHYNPYENYADLIEVKESAKERYNQWITGNIKT
jgi:hypothetical protein